MLAGADEAFIDLWSRSSGKAAAVGITAAEARRLARWGFVSYSVGMCDTFMTATDRADYEEGLNAFAYGITDGNAEGVRYVQEVADKWQSEGRSIRPPVDQRNSFCKVELAAVRQLLREI